MIFALVIIINVIKYLVQPLGKYFAFILPSALSKTSAYFVVTSGWGAALVHPVIHRSAVCLRALCHR